MRKRKRNPPEVTSDTTVVGFRLTHYRLWDWLCSKRPERARSYGDKAKGWLMGLEPTTTWTTTRGSTN